MPLAARKMSDAEKEEMLKGLREAYGVKTNRELLAKAFCFALVSAKYAEDLPDPPKH